MVHLMARWVVGSTRIICTTRTYTVFVSDFQKKHSCISQEVIDILLTTTIKPSMSFTELISDMFNDTYTKGSSRSFSIFTSVYIGSTLSPTQKCTVLQARKCCIQSSILIILRLIYHLVCLIIRNSIFEALYTNP